MTAPDAPANGGASVAGMSEVPVEDGLFPGFRLLDVDTSQAVAGGARLRVRVGGNGPPLLLLHGSPQTHAMWHAVAPALARRFTLVCPDLRGYGDSEKPPSTPDHGPYTKRAMAADMAGLMTMLGFERFQVGSHDRGARVGHRLALDHGPRVSRLAVLDIAPTREMYRDTTDRFARAYWHWFFLIQPAPIPERMIAADPDVFFLRDGRGRTHQTAFFHAEALAHYRRTYSKPETIAAICEDYRAAATTDIAHDDADAGRKVACPVLAMWGRDGAVGRCFDPLALWRERAEDVRGFDLPGGHYLAEEVPDETARAFLDFFEA